MGGERRGKRSGRGWVGRWSSSSWRVRGKRIGWGGVGSGLEERVGGVLRHGAR